MFRAILELCRISNLPTVWTNVIAAWIFVTNGDAWHAELLWLLLGGSLVYCAGMILNDTCDAAWDREKRPERPIPSGRISLKTAWVLGIVTLAGGAAVMVVGGKAWALATTTLVAAIVMYDVYHKPWAGSVLIMGLCRTLLFATAGWAAMGIAPPLHSRLPDLTRELTFFIGLIEGTYVVALTLIARAEGKGEVTNRRTLLIPMLMLPALLGALFAVSTIIYAVEAHKGWTALWYTAGAFVSLASFIAWTVHALRQMRKGGTAIGQAVGLLLAGIPLVDAIVISPAMPGTALGFCCLPPLLRYWQRWVAAT